MSTFARGAKPTPKHKLLAASPHVPLVAAPPQFAVVPRKLSMWENNAYGCCVTTEEAFAKAAWSIFCGLPETFVTDTEVLRWASKYGYLNGAYLTEVMDTMARDGLNVSGTNYKDGPYKGVDYSNEAVLQSAIATGPVKIGIDADALPGGAGNGSGWYAVGGRSGQYPNEDHCVGLCGFGTAEFLYAQLFAAGLVSSAAAPPGLAGKSGYLLFTWGGIGFVDHAWIMSTVAEAWVRTPTTPGQSPTPAPVPPSPPAPPPPGPVTFEVKGPPKDLVLPVQGSFFGGKYVVLTKDSLALTGTIPGK